MWKWDVFGLVLLLSLGFLSPSRAERKSVEVQLKGAIQDAAVKLGPLEDWKKVLLEDEVIPQYERFIKNYSASGDGLKVDVDLEEIQRYLGFHAIHTLKQKDPRVVAVIKSDPACAKCTASTGSIQKLIQRRLARRGYQPLWVDSKSWANLLENGVQHHLAQAVQQKNSAVGGVVVETLPAPPQDEDAFHVGEQRYEVHIHFLLNKGPSLTLKKEAGDSDELDLVAGRLFTDLFADLSGKVKTLPVGDVNGSSVAGSSVSDQQPSDELLVEISGIQDFSQYSQVKNLLVQKLQELAAVEERAFSKGKAVLVLSTNKNHEDVKNQFKQIHWDVFKSPSLKVEIR